MEHGNAVVELRHAASLPRTSNFRRPPMYVEAVSDGGRSQAEEQQEVIEPTYDRSSCFDSRPDFPAELQRHAISELSTSVRKRNKGSRSHSRDSRALKGRELPQRAASCSVNLDDNILLADDILLDYSGPSHSVTPPTSRVPISPNFLSPETPLLYPNVSPSTPLMRTLGAIHKSLLRANSAAAPVRALYKLTGGDLRFQDSMFPSPSISPQPGRDNIHTSGERLAACTKWFTVLGENIKDFDVGDTSGEEEHLVISKPEEQRRHKTAWNSAGESRRATATTVAPLSTPNININENASIHQTKPVWAMPYQQKRRSIVVEQDDDAVVSSQSTYPRLPTTPRCSSPGLGQGLPHSSDPLSIESPASATGAVGLPLYPSVKSLLRQDLFSFSPSATPQKSVSLSSPYQRGDVESENLEEVVYPVEHLRRSPYYDAFDGQIGWVPDPFLAHDRDEDEEWLSNLIDEDDNQTPPESPGSLSDFEEPVVDAEPSFEQPSVPSSSNLSAQTTTLNITSTPVSDESDSLQQAWKKESDLSSNWEDIGSSERSKTPIHKEKMVMCESAQADTEDENRHEEEERIRATYPSDLKVYIIRDGEFPVAAGGCADIYKGTIRLHQMSIKIAIKTIKVYSAEGNHRKKARRLRRELRVWMKLDHPNVLSLFGTTSGFGPFPAMVCPWLENGTLTSYLERYSKDLEIPRVLALIHDVASGLLYLHSQSIVHGDLSGSNVLIDANGRACIADFGLSTVLDEIGGSTFATSSIGKPRGTLRWAAPELLDLVDHGDAKTQHNGPTTQSDIYSFGGIMLQILSGKVPYHYYSRDMQIVAAIFRGETPARPDNSWVTDRRWEFIRRCWSPFGNIVRRPSSEEIVAFSTDDLVGNSSQVA